MALDVKTARRTVEIFEVFAKAQAPMSLSELGRALNAPMSSCYNLINALESRGYLYSVGTRRRLYPTRRLLEIALAIESGEPWLEHVEPVLTKLCQDSGETIILGKQQGSHIVYLSVIESAETIRYTARVGDVKPLHASAIGKALLASLPEKDRATTIANLSLEKITDTTITDPAALLAELNKSAERGYAITNGERVIDVMAIAAPVSLAGETCAVAVAGPMSRMASEKDRKIELLLEAARQITNN